MRDTDIQSTNDHFNMKRSELTFDVKEKKRDTVTLPHTTQPVSKCRSVVRSTCILSPHPDTTIRARVCLVVNK
jgi:hypothetical protein